MVIAGLTGGIGSGKSTAARRFEELEIPVIDADKLGHELIAPGGRAEAAVASAFGPEVLSHGKIERSKLGAVVFADRDALKRLNAIVHPLLAEAIEARCASYAAEGKKVCIVDAALLGEGAALEPWLDCLILVAASEDTRVRRLIVHRGMSEQDARERMASQVDPERKRRLARWVLENDGSVVELHVQVDEVARALLTLDGSA